MRCFKSNIGIVVRWGLGRQHGPGTIYLVTEQDLVIGDVPRGAAVMLNVAKPFLSMEWPKVYDLVRSSAKTIIKIKPPSPILVEVLDKVMPRGKVSYVLPPSQYISLVDRVYGGLVIEPVKDPALPLALNMAKERGGAALLISPEVDPSALMFVEPEFVRSIIFEDEGEAYRFRTINEALCSGSEVYSYRCDCSNALMCLSRCGEVFVEKSL